MDLIYLDTLFILRVAFELKVFLGYLIGYFFGFILDKWVLLEQVRPFFGRRIVAHQTAAGSCIEDTSNHKTNSSFSTCVNVSDRSN